MTVRITPLPVRHTLTEGLDLVATVQAALADGDQELADGDVVVVASKVVALAEGAVVDLPDDRDPTRARRTLARRQAARVVADHPRVLVVETHHGFVCANAGVDTSNVPPGQAVLLPEDPDASAARLREDLRQRTGRSVGVLVTDTFGRPWREGQVDVAIGAAGLDVLRDERDGHDLWGRVLEVTTAAIADEIAGAADLVRRKDSGVPFVLVRGLDAAGEATAADLVRPAADDLFPAGGPTMADHVVARARHRAGATTDGTIPALVELAATPDVEAEIRTDADHDAVRVQLRATAAPDDPEALVSLGASIARLEVLAAARDWRTSVDPVHERTVTIRLEPSSP